MTIDEQIANTIKAVNNQVATLANETKRGMMNVYITEDAKIATIEDPRLMDARIDDARKRLDDLLRRLDTLLGEKK